MMTYPFLQFLFQSQLTVRHCSNNFKFSKLYYNSVKEYHRARIGRTMEVMEKFVRTVAK